MAAILKRGEIYWADLNPVQYAEQTGLRPRVSSFNSVSLFSLSIYLTEMLIPHIIQQWKCSHGYC